MATLTTPETVSMNPAGLEEVKRVFNRQISEGLHPGAGLAVYRYGSLVLDIHGGVADSGTGRRVDDKTMFVLFSSTKPLAGACVYMLKERGRLEWDDPVAKFWPEFGQNGKETVTIRHLLSHQGRLPGDACRPAVDRLARLEPGMRRHGASHAQIHTWVHAVVPPDQLRVGDRRAGPAH